MTLPFDYYSYFYLLLLLLLLLLYYYITITITFFYSIIEAHGPVNNASNKEKRKEKIEINQIKKHPDI